jgi:hypothetical protein
MLANVRHSRRQRTTPLLLVEALTAMKLLPMSTVAAESFAYLLCGQTCRGGSGGSSS